MVRPKLSLDATDKIAPSSIAGKTSMKNLLINIPSPRDQGKPAEILQKSIGLPPQEQVEAE